MKSELLPIIERMFAGGLNGVYQGVLITLAVALGLRCVGRTNAATRHAVWFATLLLVVALVPLHCLLEWRDFAPLQGTSNAPNAAPPAALLNAPALASLTAPTRSPDAVQDDFFAPDEADDASDGSMAGSVPSPETALRQSHREGPAATGTAPKAVWERVRIAATTSANEINRWLTRAVKPVPLSLWADHAGLRWASVGACSLWLLLALTRLGILAVRLYRLKLLKGNSTLAAPEVESQFRSLCADLQISRRVAVRCSSAQRAPVLLGFVHPLVLLPGSETTSGREELEQVFRHELAHVARRDDWANLIQNLCQAVLFFDPAVWWVCRRLSLEREIACDDCVLQQGAAPRAYALVLTSLAGRLTPSPLAAGLSANKSQLQQRIRMILNTQRDTSARLGKARVGLLIATSCSLLALCAGPRLVLAQAPAPPAPPRPGSTAETPEPPAAGLPPVPTAEAADQFPEASSVSPAPKDKLEAGGPTSATLRFTPAPVLPMKPGRSVTPLIVAVHPPVATIKPHPAPDAPDPDNSIEERLDRLEKMVQKLTSQQPHGRVSTGGGGYAFGNNWELFGQNAKKKAELDQNQAENEAKRAKRDAEKFAFDQQAWAADQGEASKRQLEALRRTRESLAREVEHLDREIKRLEEQKSKGSDVAPRRSSLNDGANLNLDLQKPRLAGAVNSQDWAEIAVEAPRP